MFDLLNSPEKSRDVPDDEPAEAKRAGKSRTWVFFRVFVMALAWGAALARLLYVYQWQSLPVTVAAVGTLLFAYIVIRIIVHASHENPLEEEDSGEGLRRLLDSAAPAVLALDLQGELIYSNPAAERLLGYSAAELELQWNQADILGPGECERLVEEMQKLCHVISPPEFTRAGYISAYLACVRMLPPNMVPVFSAQVRHKDGNYIQVVLHVSALRDAEADVAGMVVVAMDQGSIPQ